jgi:large subunit ribosomal protein L29
MKTEDIKKLNDEEIGVELRRLRDRHFTLRSQAITDKVENNAEFGNVRKDVARLMTAKRARAMAKTTAPARAAAPVKAVTPAKPVKKTTTAKPAKKAK